MLVTTRAACHDRGSSGSPSKGGEPRTGPRAPRFPAVPEPTIAQESCHLSGFQPRVVLASSEPAVHQPSSEPRITVLRSKYVPTGAPSGAQCGPPGGALTHRWQTDAHMQQGHSEAGGRLVSASIGREPIDLTIIAFDMDATGRTATPDWQEETRRRCEHAEAPHPGASWQSRSMASAAQGFWRTRNRQRDQRD